MRLSLRSHFTMLCLGIFLSLSLPTSATAEDNRVALVVGNSNYPKGFDLQNPINDAVLIQAALTDVGFEKDNVEQATDLDSGHFEEALGRFYEKASHLAVGRNGVALIYFAGHGLQIGNENFLLPTDSRFFRGADQKADIISSGIKVKKIIEALKGRGVRNIIILLDACRTNKFDFATTSGLVEDNTNSGSPLIQIVVGYATRYGDVALDGKGLGNSPYATALATQLRVPGRAFSEILTATQKQVILATQNAPEPQAPQATGSVLLVLKESPQLSAASGFTGEVSGFPIISWDGNRREKTFKPSKVGVISVSYQAIGKCEPGGLFFTSTFCKASADLRTQFTSTRKPILSKEFLPGLLKEAEGGTLEAIELLSSYYYGSYGSAGKDSAQYHNFLLKGVSLGGRSSIADYGLYLCCDRDGPKNVEEGIALLQAAASSSNDYAQVQLATLYLFGDPVKADFSKAEQLLTAADKLGYWPATAQLGDLYYYTENGHVDRKRARDYYQKAFDAGAVSPALNLADLLENGVEPDGRDANPNAAYLILNAAKDVGCGECWSNMARLLDSGKLGPRDKTEVFGALAHGDAVNDLVSVLNMAGWLRDGVGTGRNQSLAYEKFAKAADMGNAYSKYVAARGALSGTIVFPTPINGIKPDIPRAAAWLRALLPLDLESEEYRRFQIDPGDVWDAGRMLAELIEHHDILPMKLDELQDLRRRFGKWNESTKLRTEVDCNGKKDWGIYYLIDWQRPNDETPLDVGSAYNKWQNGCAVPAAKLAEIKALQRQARGQGKSFIGLVRAKYPDSVTPPKP